MNLNEYVKASQTDSNLWWRLASGTQLNLLDEAIEENELYGSMKEGVAQRIGDLEQEIRHLHAYQRECDAASNLLTKYVGYGVGCLQVAAGVEAVIADLVECRRLLREACQDSERVEVGGVRCWEIVVTDEWFREARKAGGTDAGH